MIVALSNDEHIENIFNFCRKIIFILSQKVLNDLESRILKLIP